MKKNRGSGTIKMKEMMKHIQLRNLTILILILAGITLFMANLVVAQESETGYWKLVEKNMTFDPSTHECYPDTLSGEEGHLIYTQFIVCKNPPRNWTVEAKWTSTT